MADDSPCRLVRWDSFVEIRYLMQDLWKRKKACRKASSVMEKIPHDEEVDLVSRGDENVAGLCDSALSLLSTTSPYTHPPINVSLK